MRREKQFTRLRDELSASRRALPMVRVEKDYRFEGPDGAVTLEGLFGGQSQLIVYNFMYGPDWPAGCKSCSFWADNYNGITEHLKHRDVSLVTVSRAPIDVIEAFRQRMGWRFSWVSSYQNDFNRDYHVSFSTEQMESGSVYYNYHRTRFPCEEAPGISVFYRDENQNVYHTYSCYARGLDMLNGAYHLLDLVPKGRDESDLPFSMAWLKLRDEY